MSRIAKCIFVGIGLWAIGSPFSICLVVQEASAQSYGYEYPVVNAPNANVVNVNDPKFQSDASARLTKHLANGSFSLIGSAASSNQNMIRPTGYVVPPTPLLPPAVAAAAISPPPAVPTPIIPAPLTLTPNSRSPVVQQQSSTMPQYSAVPAQASTAQQAQAQAAQLARQAQAQQAQAQMTMAHAWQAQAMATQMSSTSLIKTAYRQPVYRQTTLGLGNPQIRTAQNCNPGYIPAATNLMVPQVQLQNMPAGTFLGTGIVGQPTAYRDGQPVRNLFRYITP